MIDGSSLPYEENVALTKKVVEYAHQFDNRRRWTWYWLALKMKFLLRLAIIQNRKEVIDFTQRTGVDPLAISIGTSHGAYKFKPEQCTRDPEDGTSCSSPIGFWCSRRDYGEAPGFPIVLHGSSSVPQEYVEMINKYGGKMPDAVGIPGRSIAQGC